MVKVTENKRKVRELVIEGMLDKKANDIVVLDLTKVKGAVTDYFIICSANSDTQVDAIADSIEKEVYKNREEWPWRTEGKQNREWILIDYVDVVAHIFRKDKRDFFALEELWGDAKITKIENEIE